MLKITSRKIDELLPYARNARTHSDTQVSQVAASIVEFGWTNPILTDGNNGVVAGHCRLSAAKKLRDAGTNIPYWKDVTEVPTIDLAHLTKAQKKAYVLADNKLALNAGWAEDLLVLELTDLQDDGFDLDIVGFDPSEIDALFANDQADQEPGASQTREIDADEFQMECRCPKCGFEFDPK